MRISNGSDHEIGAHKSPGKSESGIKLVSIFHLSQNLQGSFYLFLFLYFFYLFALINTHALTKIPHHQHYSQ